MTRRDSGDPLGDGVWLPALALAVWGLPMAGAYLYVHGFDWSVFMLLPVSVLLASGTLLVLGGIVYVVMRQVFRS